MNYYSNEHPYGRPKVGYVVLSGEIPSIARPFSNVRSLFEPRVDEEPPKSQPPTIHTPEGRNMLRVSAGAIQAARIRGLVPGELVALVKDADTYQDAIPPDRTGIVMPYAYPPVSIMTAAKVVRVLWNAKTTDGRDVVMDYFPSEVKLIEV